MIMAPDALLELWRSSGDRLARRCEGLTDEEYHWLPVAEGWTVHPDPAHPDRWTYEYDFAPPLPHPITTIGWRLVHLIADNEIYWEFAFGPGLRTFAEIEVPSTAADGIAAWKRSRDPITDWLTAATDAELAEPRPSHLGADKTAAEVISILLDEQIHHGAEIALLRDLYAHR